jgi:hypothetical protein
MRAVGWEDIYKKERCWDDIVVRLRHAAPVKGLDG